MTGEIGHAPHPTCSLPWLAFDSSDLSAESAHALREREVDGRHVLPEQEDAVNAAARALRLAGVHESDPRNASPVAFADGRLDVEGAVVADRLECGEIFDEIVEGLFHRSEPAESARRSLRNVILQDQLESFADRHRPSW